MVQSEGSSLESGVWSQESGVARILLIDSRRRTPDAGLLIRSLHTPTSYHSRQSITHLSHHDGGSLAGNDSHDASSTVSRAPKAKVFSSAGGFTGRRPELWPSTVVTWPTSMICLKQRRPSAIMRAGEAPSS